MQPIGVSGDDGFVVVGCTASGFPNEAEALLLSVAANQAAVALQATRMRMQAELERGRLRDLLAKAPAAIGLLHGPEHRWTYVNSQYVQLTGRNSADDFLGKTIVESLPELESQVFVGLLNEVYCTGKPYFGREMKGVLKRSAKGLPDESYWDFVYQPVRDAEGKVEGIFVHAVEVTDRVLARDAITETAERLRLAQTAAQIGTWEWDPVRDFSRLSPELHRLFGTEAEDPGHAKRWAERVYPDDWAKVQQCMTEGHRSGGMDFEYRYVHPQDGLRWFYCKGRRFASETRMFGIVQDITQRKHVEEALAESEERYRTVTETASDAIISIDENSTVLFANSATAQVFGYKPDEIVGKNLSILMPDHMRHLHHAGLQRYIATGKRHLNWDATELPGLHKDGRELPLEVSFGEYTRAGKHYFTGFARDITQRKLASEALQQSEQRLRTLVNATSYVVYRMSPDWSEMRQLDGGGFISDTRRPSKKWIDEYIHPDDQPLVLKSIRHAIETKSIFELEHRVRRIDGTLGWTFSRAVPLLDKNGNIVEWFGSATDVTARVNAQEARRRLAAIVESSDDAIVSKDLNGIVTSWNRQAERLFGYTEEEMIGRSILTIIPPELHGDEDMILSKIRSGQKIDHFETVRVAKSGERIDVSLSISPVRDEQGKIVGAAKIARDIREKKKIERALRTTEKLAAAGRLAATVAHEINNPLEAVANLVYLAKRDLPDANKVASYLSNAKQELNRVAHITRQTLGFYRDTSSPVRFDVSTTLDDLLALYERRFQTRNVKVVKQYDDGAEICALAGEIRQALSNLLTNALDAMPSGGTLALRVRKTHAWTNPYVRGVRIAIADSGSGIPREHRQNLFQPFFTTKADVGTGLGLWISRGIIEKHGGLIHVRSQTGENHGTTVSIFLPFEGKPQEEQSQSTLSETEKELLVGD
jgi:PAS domain S-box-containing protein